MAWIASRPRPVRFSTTGAAWPALLLLSWPAAARAADPPVAKSPRIVLALSGGGARGIAHVGALRAFEEAGIPIDGIAANSMGAVIGGIYATGRSASELEAIVRSLDWGSLGSGRPDRRTLPLSRRADRYAPLAGISFDWKGARLPAGLVAEQRVNSFLIQYLAPASFAAGGDFDRLPIPFRAVATDLADGERVVLAQGDLALAVRASLSIPLAFAPVEWQGRRLVDGLLVDNLPVDVARGWQASLTVAVDVGSPELEPAEYASALGVASRVNDLLMKRRNRDFRASPDVLVRPALGRHGTTDYSGFDELIRQGYEAAKAVVPQIRERLAAAGVDDLERRLPPAGGRSLEGAAIKGVVVRGNLRLDDRLILRTFNIPTGPGYEMAKGLRAFDKISATGLLERSWLEFEPEADGVRVVLRVSEAPPFRAEAAVGYSEWERTRAAVRLVNRSTFGFGEQVELLLAASDAESRAELSLRGERLALPGLGYAVRAYTAEDKPRYFDADGHELNRARFLRSGADFALRAPFKRWFELEGGLRLGQVKTRARAGLDLEPADDAVRTVFANAAYDTLDSLAWPEHGERVAARGEWSPRGLGPSHAYWRLDLRGRLARPLAERTVVQLDGLLGLSRQDLPASEAYRVGGVELLPGYAHEELKGAQAFAAAVSLRQRLVGELRVVARAGAGNVFERGDPLRLPGLRYGVALGLVLPTRVGPVAAELGLRDKGGTLVSLTLGWD